MTDSRDLLQAYVKTGSEPAFRELVGRYIDLVYSSAVRLVDGDAHLAQDVTQTVFADLARMARKLSGDSMLGGWLHRHTCFVARNTMRGERRRQLRERQAVEMNSTEDHSEANLASITPVLDEAIDELGPQDRAAILLRFFEQKNFHSVGEALGGNEEAARKRVHRALDKLRALLTRRGVVLSAAGLATALTTHAVAAAPAGLALSVSTAALATAAAGGGTALTFLQIMGMTKLKIGIATAVIAAIAIPLAMEYRNNRNLREENEALRQRLGQIDQLSAENKRLSGLLANASSSAAPAATNDQFREVLKLRGEVGRLKTAENAPRPSALSGVIGDPEMRKVIRDQQKLGMTVLYKDFTNRVNLAAGQGEKFVNLLADDIMENIDHITAVLREGKSPEEMNRLFTEQEVALQEKLKALLGPEGLSQYQDYTRNLASYLTAEQFKPELSGDKAAKDEKSRQIYDLMREETRGALADAGLPADFQTLPMLNFRNMASEQEAEKNLQFMDSVFERVAGRAAGFLSPEEIRQFNDFRAKAVQNNRMVLAMNRRMMGPASK